MDERPTETPEPRPYKSVAVAAALGLRQARLNERGAPERLVKFA
jgi:hypothetical protein